jgi:Xaa-Pro aminopeptidase
MKNRKKFISLMDSNSIAVVHSNTLYTKSADMNYEFEADREFFYLTGIEKPDFIYMAEKNSDYVKETLFAYRKDEYEEKWTGYRLTSRELTEISGIEDVVSIDKFYNFFAQTMSKRSYKKVYINTKILSSWKNYKTPQEYLAETIQGKYPYTYIKNTSEITVPLRNIKEKYEIDLIKQAAAVTNKGLLRMMRAVREGINEKELEAEFEYEVIKAGMKNSFSPIVASGANGLVLHYNENNNIISSGSLVLVDAGASCKNYCADVSRTFPANGKFDIMQRKVYDIVLAANEAVISFIKDGVTFAQLENIAKSILSKGLKELGILKSEDELGKYYYHTIGHSLGLDAHDPCDKSLPIKSGMALTVEPGLYIKELNIAIRIEDNVLVSQTGCEVLTKDIIKKAEDIEKYMLN